MPFVAEINPLGSGFVAPRSCSARSRPDSKLPRGCIMGRAPQGTASAPNGAVTEVSFRALVSAAFRPSRVFFTAMARH